MFIIFSSASTEQQAAQQSFMLQNFRHQQSLRASIKQSLQPESDLTEHVLNLLLELRNFLLCEHDDDIDEFCGDEMGTTNPALSKPLDILTAAQNALDHVDSADLIACEHVQEGYDIKSECHSLINAALAVQPQKRSSLSHR